ncbi:MAG: rhamnogalacturonan acetylesterase [Lachnospiraceae bacterium]|nr:rhamnogalacturonan acetylesterase [Lachnospiraceae bacterium]
MSEHKREVVLELSKEGIYRVFALLHATVEEDNCVLFFGPRRMVFRGSLKPGEKKLVCFLVNMDREERHHTEDGKVRVWTFSKEGLLREVYAEKTEDDEIPTVYVAGDSTVTDQEVEDYHPRTSYCGWAQTMPCFLSPEVGWSNFADSGLTTESFREQGYYDLVKKRIRPGDFFLMQFGHNDQKISALQAETGYRERLIRYIDECREMQVNPILTTPVGRNIWKQDGTYHDLLKEHADAVRKIAKEKKVPLIDLHKRSVEWYKKMGADAVCANGASHYFHPGDYTHFNDYGAYQMASFVASEMRKWKESAYAQLGSYVTAGLGAWIPDKTLPDGVEAPAPTAGMMSEFTLLEAIENARKGLA